jgi:phage/plasmid-like protein (TIGR03299 family)
MSANIEYRNGRASFAYDGDASKIWWGAKGATRIDQSWTAEQTLAAANLNYQTIKVPAYRQAKTPTTSALGDGWKPVPTFDRVDNAHFIARADTGELLSDRSCSDVYKPHQNLELYETVRQYVDVDPEHWRITTLGALGNGARVYFSAEYNGKDHTVGGDKFKFYLLSTTSHDMTGASTFQGSTIRVVCQNTFHAATAHPKGLIKVRHNTKFDKARAGNELAEIIKSFDTFKVVGDSMARVHMAQDAVVTYFKSLLDIPFDAKRDDISTRKLNQYETLFTAYRSTLAEGTDQTVWAAFNGATRFVDHERATRGGDNVSDARFASSQFGSGAALKAKAWDLLLPLVKDKVAA